MKIKSTLTANIEFHDYAGVSQHYQTHTDRFDQRAVVLCYFKVGTYLLMNCCFFQPLSQLQFQRSVKHNNSGSYAVIDFCGDVNVTYCRNKIGHWFCCVIGHVPNIKHIPEQI